jgi:hypothetical protein
MIKLYDYLRRVLNHCRLSCVHFFLFLELGDDSGSGGTTCGTAKGSPE